MLVYKSPGPNIIISALFIEAIAFGFACTDGVNLKSLILNHKSLFIAVALFLIAATISVFTSIDLRAAAGEWKAFYFEPILVFIILITSLNKNNFNNNQKISNFHITITS